MFRLFKKKKPSKNQPQESETNTAEEQVLDAETDFLEQQLEHQSIEQPNQAEVQKKFKKSLKLKSK